MRVLLVVVAALALAGPAAADPIRVPDQPAELVLDDGWTEEAPPAAPDGPAMVLRHEGGLVLAVTVVMLPNPDAWRSKTSGAYTRAVVAGFAATPGVKVKKSKVTKVGRVPCVDVALERDGAPVAVRVLLFRSRTIIASAEGGSAAASSKATKSLRPR